MSAGSEQNAQSGAGGIPKEQVRFAVVLNGGVSLAVWMGGSVLEVDRLTRGSGPYRHLLGMVGATARADVITGTSAGGINGAALALSQVNEAAKLERLRDLWSEQGRMEQLLRTPFQGAPVSLLRGDEFFLPRLHEALERLTDDYRPLPAHERPVDLRITTTLLTGVPSVTYDDLGEALVQSSHQGSFSFRRDPYGWARPAGETAQERPRDDFAPTELDRLIPRMALAARSSASFPFAFEPSRVPVNGGGPVDMAGVASWTDGDRDLSRYAVDGGVLVNTPTREALEAIDRMPAEGPVRRVMLLVFPHAPGAPEGAASAELGPPTAVGASGQLLGALTSQSGRTYVERIEEHNRRAATRRGGRGALLSRLHREGAPITRSLYELTRTLRGHYEDVRIRLAARDLATRELDKPGSNAAGWTFERVRAAAEVAQRTWLREHGSLPYVPVPPLPVAAPVTGWPWGISMAERLVTAAMDLLKRLVWVVPAEGPGLADCARITGDRTVLHRVRAELRRLHEELDSEQVRAGVEARVRAGLRLPDDRPVELNQVYWRERLQNFTERMGADSEEELGQRVRAQVALVAEVLGHAHAIITGLSPERRSMVGLEPWCLLLTEPITGGESEVGLVGDDVWLSRLLALEVATTCLADDSISGLDQAVELVQVSLRTRNAFADYSRTPDDKAGGASLSRFSGFLKRSWRVNDWIWGRLDGASMLCRVLFEPTRLRRVDKLAGGLPGDAAQRAEAVVADLVAELFGSALPEELRAAREAAVAELTGVYASGESDLPPTCAALADLAAWGLHARIICEELPALRQAILADRADGADRRSRGELFLEEHAGLLARLATPPITTEETAALGVLALRAFDRAGIGREPISQEAGSDQVIRTAATAAAVAVTVADSDRSGLGPVKPLTRALRGAALLPYWMINGLTRGGNLSRFLGLVGLALGGALLVLSLFGLLPGWAVAPAAALGAATLLAAFGYAALRSGTLLHGLVLLSPVLPLASVAVLRSRVALGSGTNPQEATTGVVAIAGVGLVVACLLALGSLPSPVGTPLAVLKRVRVPKRLVGVLAAASLLWLGVREVVARRLYEVDWRVAALASLVAVAIGFGASFALGRSMQRWRRAEDVGAVDAAGSGSPGVGAVGVGAVGVGAVGVGARDAGAAGAGPSDAGTPWVTEHAEPPSAATAGWAGVYGTGYLALVVLMRALDLRFTGWEAVLCTGAGFGAVLLLVTTWWVPLRGRARILADIEDQSVLAGVPDEAAFLRRLEGHGGLFRFLVGVRDGHPVLRPAGKRAARRVADRVSRAQAASAAGAAAVAEPIASA
ncbi:patatin-like protein [Actinosynnema mirum]|uniref:Patatin n=1 Tax=Actinosynnema mirum (strain ATCC 29888 / DSM 43827 / JCM 3225 / NBRC 14064 / NCIMB 13271 / NRRL B-12336 / IMRU 3971 / 101) TaxID=446462 RepID=C6W8D3_ACTMD|nr:patatin-like protein [Actinosynnema mirum]ACU38980.1 Patatin [Actinosynnema mirum DSM 43827]